jgi:hypothetical protein
MLFCIDVRTASKHADLSLLILCCAFKNEGHTALKLVLSINSKQIGGTDEHSVKRCIVSGKHV